MSKITNLWLMVALILVVVGAVIFVAVMTAKGWDFRTLSTIHYEAKTYTVTEDFSQIQVTLDTARVVIAPSDQDVCQVACYEAEKIKYQISASDGILCVTMQDTRQWYEYISISFDDHPITIYLPQTAYDALTVQTSTGDIHVQNDFRFDALTLQTSTGDIHVQNLTAKTIDLFLTTGQITLQNVACEGDVSLHVSTGDVDISGLTCENLTSTGDTGSVKLVDVVAGQTCQIQRTTGDIKLQASDASELYLTTDTGDVKGTILTPKTFVAKTSTGNIDLPPNTVGGKCEITTSTGDVRIRIE